MRYFYGMLDIMRINSHVLNSLAGSDCSRKDFLKSVGYSMVEPQMKRRACNQRISRSLRFEIGLIIENEETTSLPTIGEPFKKKKKNEMPHVRQKE